MKALLLIILLFMAVLPQQANSQNKGLKPDFYVAQYAGSIGYLSAGTGYDIFKSKGKFSLHFGSVPKSQGGPLNILAAKLFFEPKVVPVWSNMEINPFDVGIMLSYHFGENFKTNVPNYFSDNNYYWWNTSLRAHLAIESSFTVRLGKGSFVKGFTGYAEINTNDLYLISFIKNTHALKIQDIIKIGIGSRIFL